MQRVEGGRKQLINHNTIDMMCGGDPSCRQCVVGHSLGDFLPKLSLALPFDGFLHAIRAFVCFLDFLRRYLLLLFLFLLLPFHFDWTQISCLARRSAGFRLAQLRPNVNRFECVFMNSARVCVRISELLSCRCPLTEPAAAATAACCK